jgi:hypothetical protein
MVEYATNQNSQCAECGTWKPYCEFKFKEDGIVFCNPNCVFHYLVKKLQKINDSNIDYSYLKSRIRDIEQEISRLRGKN